MISKLQCRGRFMLKEGLKKGDFVGDNLFRKSKTHEI